MAQTLPDFEGCLSFATLKAWLEAIGKKVRLTERMEIRIRKHPGLNWLLVDVICLQGAPYAILEDPKGQQLNVDVTVLVRAGIHVVEE